MFRRNAPQVPPEPEAPERRYQLRLISNHPLSFGNGPERRKHLALIGDQDWTHYWFLDAIAQTQTVNLRSSIISGPRDERLRNMPRALDIPKSLCDVRQVLPYQIDPGSFRERAGSFINIISESSPTLVLMGRDLGHVWPFILGRKNDAEGKLIFFIADVTPNLKLPLSESFRYFLVQESHRAQFEKAVERWHRHDAVKPEFAETPVQQQGCTLYEIKDPPPA